MTASRGMGFQPMSSSAGSRCHWAPRFRFPIRSHGPALFHHPHVLSADPQGSGYSLNSDAVDKTFKFKPSEKMFEVGDELYLSVPQDSEFAAVPVTFQDGTVSAKQKVVRMR
jgi:hypothetical protein